MITNVLYAFRNTLSSESRHLRWIFVRQRSRYVKEKLFKIRPFPTLAVLDRPAGRRPDPGEGAAAPDNGRRVILGFAGIVVARGPAELLRVP